jgi:hypothetical protein
MAGQDSSTLARRLKLPVAKLEYNSIFGEATSLSTLVKTPPFLIGTYGKMYKLRVERQAFPQVGAAEPQRKGAISYKRANGGA